MATSYGEFLQQRREIMGMSQRELAERAGVKQPSIAAIERGHREPSSSVRAKLDRTLALRPSEALAVQKDSVRKAFADADLPEPRVFGSVARGDDTVDSDLDLIVDFTEAHDIADLLELEDRLARLLTVRTDVVDGRSDGLVVARARAEAVPL